MSKENDSILDDDEMKDFMERLNNDSQESLIEMFIDWWDGSMTDLKDDAEAIYRIKETRKRIKPITPDSHKTENSETLKKFFKIYDSNPTDLTELKSVRKTMGFKTTTGYPD